MSTTSPHIRQALDRIKELREEHRRLVLRDFDAAEEATTGAMVNARGRAKGVQPFDLFTHNPAFFRAYATPEMIEWRALHPHLSFAAFERHMFDPNGVF